MRFARLPRLDYSHRKSMPEMTRRHRMANGSETVQRSRPGKAAEASCGYCLDRCPPHRAPSAKMPRREAQATKLFADLKQFLFLCGQLPPRLEYRHCPE